MEKRNRERTSLWRTPEFLTNSSEVSPRGYVHWSGYVKYSNSFAEWSWDKQMWSGTYRRIESNAEENLVTHNVESSLMGLRT